jgi:HSP20 family protein
MVSRSFSLPAPVDPQGAKAEYKDGVLNLVLPKKANAQARRLTVA